MGVFPQVRGAEPGRAVVDVEVRRGRQHGPRTVLGGHIDQPARGVELLVAQELVHRLDRGPEEVGVRVEDGGPLVEGLGGERLVEELDELARIGGPGRRCGDADGGL